MSHGEEDIKNPYKSIKGNNPCSIIQLNSLGLKNLGFLIALYEHKVFIEATILGIDPFDQWGVQLGKKLALKVKTDKDFLKENFSLSLHPKA
jgi:glucose-6-phosphate isomerase